MYSSHLAFFLATWFDREFQCVGIERPLREAVEGVVRSVFAGDGIPLSGLWLGSFTKLVHVFKRSAPKGFKLFLYSQVVCVG
jgi:hypothetical protein